jgi:hypothetical protein
MDVLSAARGSGGGTAALVLLSGVVWVVAGVKILPKAGYSRWLALLLIIPLVNWVMILVFAFSDWPVDKELRSYRQGGFGSGSSPGGYPAPAWPAQPPPPPAYGSGSAQFAPPSWPPAGGQVPPPPAGSVPAPWPGGPVAPPPSAWPGDPPPPAAPPPWPGTPQAPTPASPAPTWPAPTWPVAPSSGGADTDEEPPQP